MADDTDNIKKKPGILRKATGKLAGMALYGTGSLGQMVEGKISGKPVRGRGAYERRAPPGIGRRIVGATAGIALHGTGALGRSVVSAIHGSPSGARGVPGTGKKRAEPEATPDMSQEIQQVATKVSEDINNLRSDMEVGMFFLYGEIKKVDKQVAALRRSAARKSGDPNASGQSLNQIVRDAKGRFAKAGTEQQQPSFDQILSNLSKNRSGAAAAAGLIEQLISKIPGVTTLLAEGAVGLAGASLAKRLAVGAASRVGYGIGSAARMATSGPGLMVGGILAAAEGSNQLLDKYGIATEKNQTREQQKEKAARRNREYYGEQNTQDALKAVNPDAKTKDDVVAENKDIKIESKRDISFITTSDMLMKASTITLDAQRLKFTGDLTINGKRIEDMFGSGSGGGGGYSSRGTPYGQTQPDAAVGGFGPSSIDPLSQATGGAIAPGGSYTRPGRTGKAAKPYYPSPSSSGSSSSSPASSGSTPPAPGGDGQYRPSYKLSEADLHEHVINTIAGEAYTNNQQSTDAVIHNMLNRVGTKGYGPSGNLLEVARAPGQYEGYRKASDKEAEFIKSRIQAIASGSVQDPTGGANEYRAGSYTGPWAQKHQDSPVIGGNRFAYNADVKPGPYASNAPRPQVDTASLRVKGGEGGQAYGGGDTHAGTLAAATAIQGKLGDDLKHFSGFNDNFHAGTRSGHAKGLAGDFSLNGGEDSSHEAVHKLHGMFGEAGLQRGTDYKIINEYTNPSSRATAGHIHYEFTSQEAAQKFAAYQQQQGGGGADATPVRTGANANQDGRPANMQGMVNLPAVKGFEAKSYAGGSGGFGGDTAMPYGVHPIGSPHAPGPTVSNYSGTNAEVFPIGTGEGNRVLQDPKLGRNRTDIQIHSDNDASKLLSAGCLAIPKSQYPQFLAHMKQVIAEKGPQVLSIQPSPAGQPHQFNIVSASENKGSTNAKLNVDQAVSNFNATGNIPSGADATKAQAQTIGDAALAGSPAVPPGFNIGKGQLADHIDKDGKLSTMATMFGRSRLIGGLGDNFAKLPQDVQDHLKNAKQLDMNKLAPHQDLIPDDMKKGLADNGLTFTPGKPAVPAGQAKQIEIAGGKPVPDSLPGGADPDGQHLDLSMADQLGAKDLDALQSSADAQLAEQIPTPPNLATSGEQVTADVKAAADTSNDKPAVDQIADSGGPGPRSEGGSSSQGSLRAPVNHPESEGPSPGSDGYGDQCANPDGGGLCAV